ncbi:hypothetical protein [Limimaricola sp. AA108-03]|uniref:hypothetical protein n=1 Tax=Limimaricola sp. AA108-03 TaxID=3425945 RepID=UPI003D76AAA6
MTTTDTLTDVHSWAVAQEEASDAIRALLRVPARLGLLDADLGTIPADLGHFERCIAGQGHALVSRARDMAASGAREDSRLRALLRRYHSARSHTGSTDPAVRARYNALIEIIAAEEGPPGSGARWNTGKHRSLWVLRARARFAPEALTQGEIDRISAEMGAGKRKGLRRAVAFLGELQRLTNELPALRGFLPLLPLGSPAGSSRARKLDWAGLPKPFRDSFEAAAEACLKGAGDHAEAFLARIEAGEDPETVMAEADAMAEGKSRELGKPTAARTRYREAASWLVRSWEDAGGDTDELCDLRQLFERTTIETAIRDQIARSKGAPDLRDPLDSTTLKARLVALTTLARRGLEDARAVAILKFLGQQHYEMPRLKLKKDRGGAGILMEVDRIAAMLRQKPALAGIWANAPGRIAETARRDVEAAQSAGDRDGEISALRRFAGAAAYALQMSRPLRPTCLRHTRIASKNDAHANLKRVSPRKDLLTFRYAPWEVKNVREVTVDVTGSDAEILREWLDQWRPRMIALQDLDPDNVYLFPGAALPKPDKGDPVALPRGAYAPSSFLDLWRDSSAVLGVHETPHRMRHVVALLTLAAHPGDYARVSAILGNTEATARQHYGRDNGEAAARQSRAAMLAAHPDLFKTLNRRHRR